MGTILHKNLTQPNQHEPLAVGTYSQQTSGSLSGGSVNGTTMVTPELTATTVYIATAHATTIYASTIYSTNEYVASLETTDIRVTGTINATFNGFTITGDISATNATFYGNVTSSSYLVTSFCGLQQEALATWMPFKFNDGVGVGVTGMEFNASTAYASLLLTSNWFWRSNFISGDTETLGAFVATTFQIGSATLISTDATYATLDRSLHLKGNNVGLGFNNGIQKIYGDGASVHISASATFSSLLDSNINTFAVGGVVKATSFTSAEVFTPSRMILTWFDQATYTSWDGTDRLSLAGALGGSSTNGHVLPFDAKITGYAWNIRIPFAGAGAPSLLMTINGTANNEIYEIPLATNSGYVAGSSISVSAGDVIGYIKSTGDTLTAGDDFVLDVIVEF